jgi:hypothetical protein
VSDVAISGDGGLLEKASGHQECLTEQVSLRRPGESAGGHCCEPESDHIRGAGWTGNVSTMGDTAPLSNRSFPLKHRLEYLLGVQVAPLFARPWLRSANAVLATRARAV